MEQARLRHRPKYWPITAAPEAPALWNRKSRRRWQTRRPRRLHGAASAHEGGQTNYHREQNTAEKFHDFSFLYKSYTILLSLQEQDQDSGEDFLLRFPCRRGTRIYPTARFCSSRELKAFFQISRSQMRRRKNCFVFNTFLVIELDVRARIIERCRTAKVAWIQVNSTQLFAQFIRAGLGKRMSLSSQCTRK